MTRTRGANGEVSGGRCDGNRDPQTMQSQDRLQPERSRGTSCCVSDCSTTAHEDVDVEVHASHESSFIDSLLKLAMFCCLFSMFLGLLEHLPTAGASAVSEGPTFNDLPPDVVNHIFEMAEVPFEFDLTRTINIDRDDESSFVKAVFFGLFVNLVTLSNTFIYGSWLSVFIVSTIMRVMNPGDTISMLWLVYLRFRNDPQMANFNQLSFTNKLGVIYNHSSRIISRMLRGFVNDEVRIRNRIDFMHFLRFNGIQSPVMRGGLEGALNAPDALYRSISWRFYDRWNIFYQPYCLFRMIYVLFSGQWFSNLTMVQIDQQIIGNIDHVRNSVRSACQYVANRFSRFVTTAIRFYIITSIQRQAISTLNRWYHALDLRTTTLVNIFASSRSLAEQRLLSLMDVTITFLINIHRATDRVSYALAFKSFIDYIGVPSNVQQFAQNQFNAVMSKIRQQFGFVGLFSDAVDDISSGKFDFKKYPIVTDFLVMAVSLSAIPLIASGDMSKAYKLITNSVKKAIKNGPMAVVIGGAFLRSYQAIHSFLLPEDTLVVPDDLQDWFTKSIALCEKFADIKSFVEDAKFASQEMNSAIGELMELEKEARQLLTIKVLSETISPILRNQLLTQRNENKVVMRNLKTFVNATTYRYQPATVTIVGRPGIGKSLFTDLTIKHHAEQFSMSADPAHVYHIRSNEDFYSGFNYGKDYFILDDPQFFKLAATGAVDSNVANLGHVVNNAPFSPNMADLEDKGKFQVLPKLVVTTCNLPDYGLSQYASDAFAFKRRSNFIWELNVREAYINLDTYCTKSEALDFKNEAYYFYRYKPVPTNKSLAGKNDAHKWHGYERVPKEDGSFEFSAIEFFQEVGAYFDRHDRGQIEYLEAFNTKHHMCPVHKVLDFVCGCTVETDNDEQPDLESLLQDLPINSNVLTPQSRDKMYREQILNNIDNYRKEIFDKAIPMAIPVTATAIAAYAASTFMGPNEHDFEPVMAYNTAHPVAPEACRTTKKSGLVERLQKSQVEVMFKDGGGDIVRVVATHLGNSWYIAPNHGRHHKRVFAGLRLMDADYRPTHQEMKFYDVGKDLIMFRYLLGPPPTKGVLKFLVDYQPDPMCAHTAVLFHARTHKRETFPTKYLKEVEMFVAETEHFDEFSVSGHLITGHATGGHSGSAFVQNLSTRGYGIGGFIVMASGSKEQLVVSVPNIDKIKSIMESEELEIRPICYIDQVSWKSFSPSTRPINPVRSTPPYIDSGFAVPTYDYGPRFRHSKMSKCVKTSIAHELPFLNQDQFVVPNFKTPFIVVDDERIYDNSRSPAHNAAKYYMMDAPHFPNTDIRKRVMDEMTQHFISGFDDVEPYRELDLIESINGGPLLDGIHLDTSFGFPFMGPKINQCDVYPNKDDVPLYTLRGDLLSDYQQYRELNSLGVPVSMPVIAQDKDEVISPEKNAKGEPRSYAAASALTLLRDKQLTGWFVSNFKKHCLRVCSAWGISSEDEWTQLYHELVDFVDSEDKFIAGDFSKFDKNLHVEMSLELREILMRVIQHFDTNNVFDVPAYESMTTEQLFAVILLGGDGYMILGKNLSGCFLTTLVNIMFNLYIHMYVFYVIYPEENFFEQVKCFFYGDDSILVCRLPEFNQQTIQYQLSLIGMKYTDADKSDNITPYSTKGKVSFLGRRFSVWKDTVLSPLRGSAWVKQLCWLSPKTNTTEQDRMLSLWPQLLREIAKVKLGDVEPDDDQQAVIDNLEEIHEVICAHYGDYFDIPEDWEDYYYDTDKIYDGNFAFATDDAVYASDFVCVADVTHNADDEVHDESVPLLQARTQFTPEPTPPLLETRVTRDIDPQVNLDNVLHRRLKVDQFTVAHNTNVGRAYMLVSSFLNDPVISSVLRNYSMIKWKEMEVTIVCTGNNFTQLLLAAGFMPMRPEWGGYPEGTVTESRYAAWMSSPVNGANGFTDQTDVMQVVQMPGPNFIDVGMSQTVKFTIPFVAPTPYLDIESCKFNTVALGGNPYDQMNFLRLISYAPLRTSNNAVSGADVIMYIQLIDAEVAGPKFVPVADIEEIQNQEREQKGSVTKVIEKVGDIADSVSHVPLIGNFAKSVSTLAKPISKITNFFGFSKPEILDPITRVSRQTIENMANTDNLATANSLTMKSGTQLKVNPGALGAGPIDQMDIKSITRLWSFVGGSTITAQTQPAFPVFGFVISPTHQPFSHITAPQGIQPTHLAFATKPFEWWRGNFEYCLYGILASNMRIVLAISMQGYSDQHQTEPSIDQYNLVVDLVQGQKIIFTTSWIRHEQVLRIQKVGGAGGSNIDINTETFDLTYHSGTIEINVLNQLVAPDPTATATFLLFQRAAPDFQVFVPANNQYNDFMPIGDVDSPNCVNFDQLDDENIDMMYLGPGPDLDHLEDNSLFWFGEQVTSFRDLVKRYLYYATMTTFDGSANNNKVATKQIGWHPGPHLSDAMKTGLLFAGYIAHVNGFLDQSRWSNSGTHMSYLRPAYTGWSGSIRHMSNFYQNSAALNLGPRVWRGTTPFFNATFPHVTEEATVLRNEGSITRSDHVPFNPLGGGLMNTNFTMNVLSYAIPFFSPLLYASTSGVYYFPGNHASAIDNQDGLRYNGHAIQAYCQQDTYWDHYVAAGDDYNLFYYIGPPYWIIDQAPGVV